MFEGSALPLECISSLYKSALVLKTSTFYNYQCDAHGDFVFLSYSQECYYLVT